LQIISSVLIPLARYFISDKEIIIINID